MFASYTVIFIINGDIYNIARAVIYRACNPSLLTDRRVMRKWTDTSVFFRKMAFKNGDSCI